MNRYIAELIDKFALNDLHRKKSETFHFNKLSQMPVTDNDLDSFYPTPSIPDIKFKQDIQKGSYDIGNFCYESQIDNGLSNKNSIGMYYDNKNADQAANVVFVHGWRMDDLGRIKRIYNRPFLNLGFNMYYYKLPYHFERASEQSLYNGELMLSADVDRTLTSVKQAVTDLRAIIKWIRANRKGKIILIGVSLGGFIANLTSVIEKEIDALISVFYANSIAYSVWNTIPGKYIKKDFERGGFTYEQLKRAWAIINPSLFEPIVRKEKILLLSGVYDHFVVSEDTNLLWESWGKPDRILYNIGHSGIVLQKRKIAKDSVSFIRGKVL